MEVTVDRDGDRPIQRKVLLDTVRALSVRNCRIRGGTVLFAPSIPSGIGGFLVFICVIASRWYTGVAIP